MFLISLKLILLLDHQKLQSMMGLFLPSPLIFYIPGNFQCSSREGRFSKQFFMEYICSWWSNRREKWSQLELCFVLTSLLDKWNWNFHNIEALYCPVIPSPQRLQKKLPLWTIFSLNDENRSNRAQFLMILGALTNERSKREVVNRISYEYLLIP